MVRTLPHGAGSRLDAGRILAYAATLAVHALAFLLLLVPMALRSPDVALPDETKPPAWIKKIEVKTPPRPETVPIVRPQTPATQPQPRAIPQTPPVPAQAIVDNGMLAADPEADSAPPADAAPATGPVPVNALAYLHAPAPKYPRDAMAGGVEGTVVLKVLVDVDGTPLEVTVAAGSGNRSLDRAALAAVKDWRFQPAMQNGHAVQAYGMVPIVFSLH